MDEFDVGLDGPKVVLAKVPSPEFDPADEPEEVRGKWDPKPPDTRVPFEATKDTIAVGGRPAFKRAVVYDGPCLHDQRGDKAVRNYSYGTAYCPACTASLGVDQVWRVLP